MSKEDNKLKKLNNSKIPYLSSQIKTSTNFFDISKESKLNYEFESSNNVSAKLSKFKKNTLGNNFINKQIAKPVRKHGVKFYAISIVIISAIIFLVSVLTTFSNRYREINKAYKECNESVAVLKSLAIGPESDICLDYPTNIFLSDYWKTGLDSADLISRYNYTISKNQSKLNNSQDLWTNVSKQLQEEFSVLSSSGTTNLTLDQILPQDSLLLGNKIKNGEIQLITLKEKNNEIADKITNILNDISNKADLYKDQINLLDYTNFVENYNKKNDNQKIASYQDLTKKYEEFNLYIESQLLKLKERDNKTATELESLEYKQFSGEDFLQLYEGYNYKFVNDVIEEVEIVGDIASDKYIEKKAVERGYRKRFIAYENRLELIDGQLLMPESRESFERMKLAAEKDGIPLTLVSGYRAPLTQKSIFNNRFGSLYSPEDILSGKSDLALDNVLATTSLPGYSKHHTGYTIDLGCSSDQLTFFKDSICFKWISQNNYLNAKKFGFIPSYPPETISKQGPNPEEWEYVWVGKEVLKNDNKRGQ